MKLFQNNQTNEQIKIQIAVGYCVCNQLQFTGCFSNLKSYSFENEFVLIYSITFHIYSSEKNK